MIVLDTHVLIWWVNGGKNLSTAARKAIESSLSLSEDILVSSITAWEIAMLANKGRLTLTMDVSKWLASTAAIEGLRYIPIDNELAIQSVTLPDEFHPDPADRMIVALARHNNASLVTADEKIRKYKHVKTIW